MATGSPRTAPHIVAFSTRLGELGYQAGKNFELEHIQVHNVGEFAAAYRELAARNSDIFVALGNKVAALAAREAAGSRPIVLIALSFDPFATGFVASLARPGGNITGLYAHPLDLARKRVELIHEFLPNARKLGLLWESATHDLVDAAAAAATGLGLDPQPIEVVGDPPNYAAALDQLSDAVVPVLFTQSPVFIRDRTALVNLFLQRLVAAVGPTREDVEAGALMCYGVNLPGALRDAAEYVDRIARGANPADLPIEQPKELELIVNLKTANLLHLSIPTTLLARADEVIE
jgi:putative ABC transport system substrate-binding protein